jgi:hypothetical protein
VELNFSIFPRKESSVGICNGRARFLLTVKVEGDEMEKLKPLDEICQPDVRYRNRVDLDHSTGIITDTTVESIYRRIEPIQLNENVPEDVRNHFEIARNLALYSWFVYSFNVVAAMQAYSSLEMALKRKTGKERISLKKTLAQALKGRKLATGLGLPIDISDAVAYLRNDLAHGNSTMHGQGIDALDLCAKLINELFS